MLAVPPPPRLGLASLSPPPLLLPRRRFLRSSSHPSRLRLLPRGGLLAPRLPTARAAMSAGIVIDVDEVSEIGDSDLPVGLSFTRRLPPALTVGDGLDALRRAADEAKSSPPGVGSGVIRFEVLVPPSTKALSWLRSQFSGSSLFPQFYLSRKQTSGPSFQLQICGIGSAICLHGSKLVKRGVDMLLRYLSSDSHLIRAYGSVGMKYDKKLLSVEEKTDSYYFFVPQVELSEFDGFSILSSTIVWDDSVSHTFEDAVCILDSCFHQIQNCYDSSASISHKGLAASYISEDWHLLETGNAQLVYLDADVLATIDGIASMQKEKFLTPDESFIRLSPQFFFCSNMDLRLQCNETESFIKSCSNINLAWASLIVEECVRLGFTPLGQDRPLLHFLLQVILQQHAYHVTMNGLLDFTLLAMGEVLERQQS